MKKVFKSVLMIGFLSISMSAMSKEKDFSLSFGKNEAETVTFEVSNAKNVSVTIYSDVDGELLSEELNSDKNVAKSYNFKDLDSGIYYLIVESESKIEKYKINVNSDKKVLIEEKPLAEIIKPEFSVNGNKAKLHFSGLKNSVKITVSDFSNTVYYNSTKSATDGELDLTFDLNPNTADNYIITVEQGGKVFNKVINLR
ncbi:T9SS type A sorting domain-containing protein [Chryseobacterium sp. PBS4-4]|uniref:T9SS type A sorting domain-containing protein n=1 Tax=Chryseobacterium edaphi TaxID=2976532 RepID=A0ABT2W3K3_9FLAO|nr:T9SS type A sorting domain-containing protein [Chryseobacterium edaphi]MCU7616796.1 T9SS type A sorting domain-containing protein [Chryseobacterium edaphi]